MNTRAQLLWIAAIAGTIAVYAGLVYAIGIGAGLVARWSAEVPR